MYDRSLSAPAAVTKQTSPHSTTLQEEQVEERRDEQEERVEQLPPLQENVNVNQWPRYRGTYAQWVPGAGVTPFPGFGAYPVPQGYMPPFNPMLAAQMAYWYQSHHGRQLPVDSDNGEGMGIEGDQDILAPPEQLNGPEAEDNAVVMNAGIGGMDAANVQRRRDLVDYVYMLTMAVFLGMMAFMTGSLGRFLIFAGGIFFMLLNQAGWFSIQRRRQDRQMTAPAPPAPRVPPQVQTPPTQAGQPPATASQQPSSSSDRTVQDDSSSSNPPEQQQQHQQDQNPAEETINPTPHDIAPPQPGLLTTILVFFTSFFTSLIPQHQPVPVN